MFDRTWRERLPAPGDRRDLPRRQMRDALTGIAVEMEVAETTYLPCGWPVGEEWDWLPRLAQRSETGLVLISGPQLRIAIEPPFPALAPGSPPASWPGPNFAPLLQTLAAKRLVAVVLLRLGAYAVGVLDSGALVASKTGTRYVHGRHRAGGQSQRRFERNREEWIRALFDRVCATARERFAPFAGRLEYLALGGDRHVLNGFLRRCDALGDLRQRTLGRRVPVARPGLAALEAAADFVWSSRVHRGAQE